MIDLGSNNLHKVSQNVVNAVLRDSRAACQQVPLTKSNEKLWRSPLYKY